MTRKEALQLVEDWTENKNLIKHMLAVEAQMRALHAVAGSMKQVSGDSSYELSADDWGVAGLVHDADYDKWPKEHPKKTLEELKKRKAPDWLYSAVETHAWKFNGMEKEPSNKLEWALYTCDELSGFIIACALVKPSKKLADVTVETVMKKWPAKSFAKGVKREQIELCEEKLDIKLPEFIKICLTALQGISDDLGL